MKYFLYVLLFLTATISLSAQVTTTPNTENNIYYKAFAAYLEKRNAMYEGNEYLKKEEYLRIFVERDILLTDTLPRSVGKNSVEYLDWNQRKEKFDKVKEPFRLVVFRPMKNEGNRLVVSFGEYLWSYKKNNSIYALSDGARVELVYDCEKKDFIVDKVTLWGI